MLYIDGAIDINARVEQFSDILPAFGVARAVDIGVRQFIHQDQRRVASEGGIKVKFTLDCPSILYFARRDHLQPCQHDLSFGAAVRFDIARHDINSFGKAFVRRFQHGIGLAHARRGPKEDF
jgi:hypothetical protein